MAYLVTGGMGCIGAWTLYHLLERGEQVVNFDISEDRHRIDLLLSPEEQARITFVRGDLTSFDAVKAAFEAHGITHVIHLAALQVPFCRANPVLGSLVNVTGTVNIFEAARQTGLKHVVYASSIAVYGSPDDYPPGLLAGDAPMLPRTLYGVFKVANEGTAKVYWQDHGVSSMTFRPYTIYGVGRDQGLTSAPTKALEAAARGEDSHIAFGGRMQFHLASDVAQQFIEAAKPTDGAYGYNLATAPMAVADFARMVMEAYPNVRVTHDENVLPFPEGCDPQPMQNGVAKIYDTPLDEGIRQTVEHFRRVVG